MADKKIELSIAPINDEEYIARNADRWLAVLDIDGSPMFDGAGQTIELALVSLIQQMGQHL